MQGYRLPNSHQKQSDIGQTTTGFSTIPDQ